MTEVTKQVENKRTPNISDILVIDFARIEEGAMLISDFIPVKDKETKTVITGWFADFVLSSGELKGLRFSVFVEGADKPAVGIMEQCRFIFNSAKSYAYSKNGDYGIKLRLVATHCEEM